MKVAVLSKWYNEIELAPYFMKHYEWADEFLIYLEKTSNDGTVEFLKQFPKVKIIWGGEEDGKLNDYACCTALSDIAANSNADWIIFCDADEFVYGLNFEPVRDVLYRANGNVIYTHMWNVFRHITDKDLDPTQPPLFQRRHGDPCRIPECVKPNVIRPEIGIRWGVGCHYIMSSSKLIIPSSVRFDGSHWQSADFDIACKRRIKGVKERLSETNLINLWASHNFYVTEQELRNLMEAHKNDPQLF